MWEDWAPDAKGILHLDRINMLFQSEAKADREVRSSGTVGLQRRIIYPSARRDFRITYVLE
jgi:hypothetical protein